MSFGPLDDGPLAVARGLEEVVEGPSVVTIGNFDGVHRGHRVLLRRAVMRPRSRRSARSP